MEVSFKIVTEHATTVTAEMLYDFIVSESKNHPGLYDDLVAYIAEHPACSGGAISYRNLTIERE